MTHHRNILSTRSAIPPPPPPPKLQCFMKYNFYDESFHKQSHLQVYLINKICYAPNSPDGACDFDPEYARSRFLGKYNQFATKLEELLEGPFIMGDTLPIYADFLLYACLFDIKNFLPNAFGPDKHAKIFNFMDKFYTYRYVL